ncbi:CueP family metal-binding protein [Sutcliffiella sp. NC1]|nr:MULTISPECIES: CueP family metal-binding protein [Sutcliffiella]MED4017897.1 CueP family metal-binding protein [Sutcliffiella cohnii]WBL17524.1 CueP family metal-binding protein [Sutcliffiella sp. NC1]
MGICFLLILGACSNNETKTVDIKQLVNEYSVGSFEEVSASITSHELIVTEEDEEVTTYELPKEEFFVSIAPYVEKTHPCAIHSLTGCQGELVEQEFDVYIEDENGNVVVDETITSLENGFIDLWLPRDQTFQVTIEYDGKETKSEISTFEGDNTCITTMQLL